MAVFRSFPIYEYILGMQLKGKCLFVFSFTVLACVQTSPPTSEKVSLFFRDFSKGGGSLYTDYTVLLTTSHCNSGTSITFKWCFEV